MKKISCIIPTYNEAPRIEGVLSIVMRCPLVNEVIVVDDCSKDTTVELVKKIALTNPKVRLITHEKNTGKSGAISTGIEASTGDYIMFIDADLIGLDEKCLTDLIEPVTSDRADVTISLRKNTPFFWKAVKIDYISGERVMPREFLLPFVDQFTKIPKFGLESFLNREIIRQKSRIKIVDWPHVESPYKYKKVGIMIGFWQDFKMVLDIFRTITPFGPFYQIYKMKKLEIK